MLDVVRQIDGVPVNDCCLLADGECPIQGRCGVVSVVEEAQRAFYRVLGGETLSGAALRMPLPGSPHRPAPRQARR
jgi:DNA-binding IscR family transcriptional regulator